MSLDIEGDGLRYSVLQKVMKYDYEFKIITIEHDVYRGYDLTERIPQRNFLSELGYILLCADVSNEENGIYHSKVNCNLNGFPFEDWWVNPKYFNENDYMFYKCYNLEYTEILKLKHL